MHCAVGRLLSHCWQLNAGSAQLNSTAPINFYSRQGIKWESAGAPAVLRGLVDDVRAWVPWRAASGAAGEQAGAGDPEVAEPPLGLQVLLLQLRYDNTVGAAAVLLPCFSTCRAVVLLPYAATCCAAILLPCAVTCRAAAAAALSCDLLRCAAAAMACSATCLSLGSAALLMLIRCTARADPLHFRRCCC